MNRKPDGQKLTTQDLADLALAHGLVTADKLSEWRAAFHHDAHLRSKLFSATQDLRFKLWSQGKLVLDTADGL